MKTQHSVLAGALLCAGAMIIPVADGGTARSNGGGDDGGACASITPVTPAYQPGMPGTHGDMLGKMASNTDGSIIAFSSYSTYFLPEADQLTPNIRQVVAHNRNTGEWELISKSVFPDSPGANANCWPFVDISPNGRYVAYATTATNLTKLPVGGDYRHVYVYDRDKDITHLASRSVYEPIGANGESAGERLGVSDTGVVVFESEATDLTEDGTNGVLQVFAHDVNSGETQLVSRHNDGFVSPMMALNPAISGDGSVVTFRGFNLVDDLNWINAPNVYLRNLDTNRTELISRHQNGDDLAGNCRFSDLSYDGRYVIFNFFHDSTHSPLDPTMDWSSGDALYVRDRQEETVVGISRAWNNDVAVPQPEHNWSVSDDGQYVSWQSQGEPVIEGGPPGQLVYRTHVPTLTAEMVSTNVFCEPLDMVADSDAWNTMSPDGSTVFFFSNRDIMMDGSFNGTYSLYAWEPKVDDVLGDLNGDGVVNVSDMLILLGAWGECQDGDICEGDLNGDFAINVSDLLILLGNWG